MRRTWRCSSIILTACSLASLIVLVGVPTAQAYTWEGRWAGTTAPYLIDGSFNSQGPDWAGSADQAIAGWNSVGPFAFVYTAGGPNVIRTSNDNGCGGPLASHGVAADGNDHINSFNLNVNIGCPDRPFCDGTQAASLPVNYWDLASVVRHELGHGMGLCHSGANNVLMTGGGLAPGQVYAIDDDARNGARWIYDPNFVAVGPEGPCIN